MWSLIQMANLPFLKNLIDRAALKKIFIGHYLSVRNLDSDPEEEIIEQSRINYSNAPDELWDKYYDFDDASGSYKFKELIKTPLSS